MDLEKYIKDIANEHSFEVKNVDKILRAKKMMFGEDVKRCPCDGSNPNRFCGSPLCIADTIKDGHCHCQLFWVKNVDNVNNC